MSVLWRACNYGTTQLPLGRLLYRPVLRVFYAPLFDANVGRQILEPARLAETDSEIIIIKAGISLCRIVDRVGAPLGDYLSDSWEKRGTGQIRG